ncbi:DUF2163 domain-containing protein [Chromobacterium violaceum]|uniref:Bacteriophage phiJL001 Gp84 C-terminal domain-containing protein n=1 Tax=Chromobacterium violaceum TaxID=536 RepID=A0A202B542_CHRVL|nr:DUF2163 domain-containing protein [Chromobacterium violaceum]OVE46683.1 hypothetical protein CBW21_17455 [Chromobacterium violaceum]
MRNATSALQALLESGRAFFMADLYTFSLVGGTIARYTSADVDLTVGGQTFSSKGPLFKRGRTRLTLGLEVDTLDLTINTDARHTLNAVPWLHAARVGALDGAAVRLERVFLTDWTDTSAGSILLFEGRVADVKPSRTELKLTVKSELELLDIQMPRNLYQPGCLHTLFQGGCGLSKAAFAVNGTVGGGSSVNRIPCALTQAAGHFALGTIRFNSGPNAGVIRSVKDYTPGVVTLSTPLVVPCNVGDGFTIYPGCDKTKGTCLAKFNNVINFRGHPYVPAPETVL